MSSEANEMDHISEELLERYSLQQLSEEQIAPIEEHLLLCSVCQEHLKEVDEYIGAVKAAARQITGSKAPVRDLRVAPRRAKQWTLPLAGGTVAAALLVLLYFGRPQALPPFEVRLTATRGLAPPITAQARAQRALIIKADAPDISAGSLLRLELANSGGKIIWHGSGEVQRGQITVQLKTPLLAGLYWFRVFESDRLRQEYRLQLE